ncbi:MAG TPA: hypothetical protein DCM01_11345 [Dielma fastidiosa]|nr:hypothetical protein [Dielma fastidiosa]
MIVKHTHRTKASDKLRQLLIRCLLPALITGCAQTPSETVKPENLPVINQPEKPAEPEPFEPIDMGTILSITNEPIAIQLDGENKAQLFIQEPTLLWDSNDAQRFNEEMNLLAQTCREELTYHENGDWHTASLLNTQYYVNDDILSIVVKLDRLLANAGVGPSVYRTYNFSLTSHELLSNAEVLNLVHVSADDFQEALDRQHEKDYLPCSSPVNGDGVRAKPCYGEYVGGLGSKYGDTSLIYIKDKEVHIIINVVQGMAQENVDIIVYKL